jgi:hypothetical protein
MTPDGSLTPADVAPLGMDDRGLPILPAYLYAWHGLDTLTYDLVVWCVHCGKWHRHAWGDGHKAAHCLDPQHYPAGYVLQMVGSITTQKMERFAEEERPRRKEDPHDV